MTNLIGCIIRVHRSYFAKNAVRLDLFDDWKVESIQAEIISGDIIFSARCRHFAWMTFGDYHIIDEKTFVSRPVMDISLPKQGVPDNCKILKRDAKTNL